MKDPKIPVDELKSMANSHDWIFVCHQPDIGMVSFSKALDTGPARINVYTTKMTVGTYLNHPKKGKTQLFRKKVDRAFMESIFKNPRVHTPRGRPKGYRRREDMW